MINQRRTILSMLAFGLAYSAASSVFGGNKLTPRQMLGPFYPDKTPIDNDNDLTTVVGRDRVAIGQVSHLFGQVLNSTGQSIVGAQIEIWQCDAFGRYSHPKDGGGKDRSFQGYGRTRSGSNGEYRFKTIRPVPYPGRTPHIHMRVVTKTGELVTQIYVEGEQLNNSDFILNSIRDTQARKSLIVPFVTKSGYSSNELAAEFNPVVVA